MQRAILVKSCQRFRVRHGACALTWAGGIRNAGVPLRFIEGGHTADLFTENLVATTTGDEYASNSLKLQRAMVMLLLCDPDFEYLFVCDDDTFVHPRRWLEHEPAGDLECRLFRPVKEADKRRHGGQPWIHGGGGWYMSRRMCELYVNEAKERTSADDILAARIAQRHGIEIVDRPDLYSGDRYSGNEGMRVAADNQLITCHHVQPAEMMKLYEATSGL